MKGRDHEMSAKKKDKAPEPEAPKEETAAPETEAKAGESAPAPAPEQPESDKLLQLMAEFDNYKKRSVRERENIYTDVRVDTVTRFLPVYDNLERAMKAETADEAYKKGVELTFTQLLEVFKGLGVAEIEALGKPFDPNLHNAVMQEETEEYESGKVCKELQKGYMLKDSVVRHSMVSVAQ